MDGTKEAQPNAREWQVTVPEGAEEQDAGAGDPVKRAAWAWLMISCVAMFKCKVSGFGTMVGKIVADDPQKTMYGIKVGIALALVSLFYYARPLYDGIGGRNVVWAIMTVVLVFEQTVGGSMYKGVNRTAGTISGTALALGLHWVASKSGKTLEPIVTTGSIFLLGAVAFSRFIPMVKSMFDYGVTVFIMTYSFVAVSGYRVEDLAMLALQRVSTISFGFFICLAVCVLVRPVWSGQELHLLTSRNMEKLADALEGCLEDYFLFADAAKRARVGSGKAEGYKCVLDSKASEDSQANLARWEPAHGKFGFRHPYEEYAKVGAAMRQCAYCVEALHGCVAAAAAPEQQRAPDLLVGVYTKIGARCARVLREASSSLATMTTSRTLALAVADMDNAVRELKSGMRALPPKLLLLLLAEEPTDASSSIDAMALLPVTLLLIEIATRIKGVADAVGTLASIGGFEPADDDKTKIEMEVPPLKDLDYSDASTVNLTTAIVERPLSRARNPSLINKAKTYYTS